MAKWLLKVFATHKEKQHISGVDGHWIYREEFLHNLYCGVQVAEIGGQADQGWCAGIQNPNKRENAEPEPEVLERFV